MKYDSIIIGCGPAGIQASIYLGRIGMKVAIIGKKDGSRLTWAHTIDNYFGFPDGIDGLFLLDKGIIQAKKFNVEIIEEEVISVFKEENNFKVISTNNELISTSIIFATGVSNQSSGILKEREYIGKGVAFCVMCDGVFFKDKKVFVIGEGDYAAKEALELLDYTKNIKLCLNGKDIKISEKFLKKLKNSNIHIIKEKIKEFFGNTKLEGAFLEDGSKLEFDGAFIAVGVSSTLSLTNNLGVMIKNNYIIVDDDFKTNVSGVFAAGDVTGSGMQVSTAVGSGAKAAISAINYIKGVL
ncbi:MAG: NAD(P)/FAD-dependent oxidoreductase [Candidatus Woesearchaeota archaeon]